MKWEKKGKKKIMFLPGLVVHSYNPSKHIVGLRPAWATHPDPVQ
jgi:hypothetical protein